MSSSPRTRPTASSASSTASGLKQTCRRCRNPDTEHAMNAETGKAGGEPIIRIEGLAKWYGHFQVLHDIDLSVQPGERIVICGPSGSGKSTLIRCINRLETVQKGRIVVDGIDLTA